MLYVDGVGAGSILRFLTQNRGEVCARLFSILGTFAANITGVS